MPLTRIKSRSLANTESFTFGGANVTGNLSVSSVTDLGSVGNVRITGGVSDYVLRTDGSGNLSWVAQTGGGSSTDSYARDTANAAFIQANAAFSVANTGGGGGTDSYARDTANAGFLQANSAYGSQNTTGTYANSAYDQANSAALYANAAFIQANSAYAAANAGGAGTDQLARDTANAAFIQANAAFIQANTGGGGGGGVSNNGSTLSGTITPLANTSEQFNILGITGDITIAAPAGTPSDGQKLIIRIKDAGTSVNISWNVIYRTIGTSLPTTTVPNKTAYIGFIYNTVDVDWDAVAISLE